MRFLMNTEITVGARVAMNLHDLRLPGSTTPIASLDEPSTHGSLSEGVVVEISTLFGGGTTYYSVKLDDFPNGRFDVSANLLRLVDTSIHTEAVAEQNEESSSSTETEEEVKTHLANSSDDGWRADPVTEDNRLSYNSVASGFRLRNKTSSSLADYFLFFLPMDHIRDVVVPKINIHGSSAVADWTDVTFLEYLTCMALLMAMTIEDYADTKTYWHPDSSSPQLNFSDYMAEERFNQILDHHVFDLCALDTQKADPLYQIRPFLAKFNETLSRALCPGKYLCIDRDIRPWIGWGLPCIEEASRESFPIHQEFVALVDNHTQCILQIDTFCDKIQQEFHDEDESPIAVVKRLCEPWFASGRTVIADSWLASPKMTIQLAKLGLYSIMQVARRPKWPQEMPAVDLIQSLSPNIGSSLVMSKQYERGHKIFVCYYRDDRGARALISSCSTTNPSVRSYRTKNGKKVLHRPQVVEDFENNKGSLDASNARDNQLSFYNDATKDYRWEVRFLSFVLGIAETNTYNCFKIWGLEAEDILYEDFKTRLAMSLLQKVKEADIDEQLADDPMFLRAKRHCRH